MIEALALAAIEAPQARLDRVADQLRAGNQELCGAANACRPPSSANTPGCGRARGYDVKIDPGCQARMNDDELAFVIAHEWGHTGSGTANESGADWIARGMVLRAGFDGPRAFRVFVTLSGPASRARNLK